MTEYHVAYYIEVEADTPEGAALEAAEILAQSARNGVYHVRPRSDGGPGRERAEVKVDLGACSRCGHEVEAHTRPDRLCAECAEERSAPAFKLANELQPGDTFRHGRMRADDWVTVRRLWRFTTRKGILAGIPMLGIMTTNSVTIHLSRTTTVYLKED